MAWLLLLQTITYGCGMPVYSLVNLWHLVSDTPDPGRSYGEANPKAVEAMKDLPLSITIGYGIPSILMAVPLNNNKLHQWFGGAWQGHPLWIVLVQLLIRALKRRLSRGSVDNS